MYLHQTCRWIALAVALGLAIPGVRADLITPDSIPNPPGTVASADGTSIYSNNNLVTTQYTGLGLNFTSNALASATAITNLNGIKVWVPASILVQPALGVAGGATFYFPGCGDQL